MIDDEEYSTFKFNGDEEPEPEQILYQDEAKDRRVEKLSHRVTIISIFIPVLIGVIFYIAYRDITSRVSQTEDTGAMEIQNLTTQLQDKFDEISSKYGELEASLAQKLADLEKVDKAMKANLKKAENTVSTINATKADKKDQQDAIAKIDTKLNPIRKELKALSTMRNDLKTLTAELQSLDADMQQKLTATSAKVDKALQNLTTIQSDMSALSSKKLDRDTLQLELLKAKKSYQKELDLTKAALDKRLTSILRKIRDLEKIAQAPLATPKTSEGGTNIVEQEITE
jgi:chromosome segregation ATPase